MIELALTSGAAGFAVLVSAMTISAGLAALPPARDIRVILGAVIFGGGWAAAIAAAAYFENWPVAGSFFLLAFIGIGVFYRLSRPRKNDPPEIVRERNWAGFVAMVLAVLTAVNIAHGLSTVSFGLRPFVIVLLGAISLIIFWAFARGFGMRWAIGFALTLLAITLLAVNFYMTMSGFLTVLAAGIIIWRGARGAARNFNMWFGKS